MVKDEEEVDDDDEEEEDVDVYEDDNVKMVKNEEVVEECELLYCFINKKKNCVNRQEIARVEQDTV